MQETCDLKSPIEAVQGTTQVEILESLLSEQSITQYSDSCGSVSSLLVGLVDLKSFLKFNSVLDNSAYLNIYFLSSIRKQKSNNMLKVRALIFRVNTKQKTINKSQLIVLQKSVSFASSLNWLDLINCIFLVIDSNSWQHLILLLLLFLLFCHLFLHYLYCASI